jgi:hypothetical protein
MDSPEGRTCVYIYRKGGGGGGLNLLELLYLQKISYAKSTVEWQKRRTFELNKTQKYLFTVCCFKRDELQFVNISCAENYGSRI